MVILIPTSTEITRSRYNFTWLVLRLRKKEITCSQATAPSSHHIIYCVQQCSKTENSTTYETIYNSEHCWICIFNICITNNTIWIRIEYFTTCLACNHHVSPRSSVVCLLIGTFRMTDRELSLQPHQGAEGEKEMWCNCSTEELSQKRACALCWIDFQST